MAKKLIFMCLFVIFIAGCSDDSDGYSAGSSRDYYLVELNKYEKEALIASIASVDGYPYVRGGSSKVTGFDSVGLVQWAYRQQGFSHVSVTAQKLYDNSFPVKSVERLERGDLVFFQDYYGIVIGNAVFDFIDNTDRIWVWDADSAQGKVTHRAIDNYWYNSELLFARATKNVPY